MNVDTGRAPCVSQLLKKAVGPSMSNALAVANKLVQVASNNNESLARLAKTSPEKAKQIRVIWTSPLIPADPLVWRMDLDAGLKKKISDFILGYGKTDDEKRVLSQLGWAPFRKSDNNQLLPIRQMEVNKKIAKIKSDEKLSDADKKKAIEPLEKQFAELGKQISALKN